MKNSFLCGLLLVGGYVSEPAAQAQEWRMMTAKALLTNDCQQLIFGEFDPVMQVARADSYDPALKVHIFLNGQPNNVEQPDPNGCILSATVYNGDLKAYLRKFYYRAPSRMPEKNPVEIKVIAMPATGPPITVTQQVYVLAERWTFQFFQALRYKCYEGGPANPRNSLALDMGMGTGMQQRFHFDATSIDWHTGEATATPDGDPEIYYSKTYQGGACDPANMVANMLWGDDDQSTIKDVKANFTGTMMKIDYKIDYMNYLGWTFTHIPSGKTLPGPPRRPGSHNVQAGFQCPLQRHFRSLYKMPPEQQVMLHVASGIQLDASN